MKEINAKTIIRKHKKIDTCFITHYTMNLYRGCIHNCSYCDARSGKYYIEGEFGKDVTVKINAPEILKKELDPKNKRIPLKKSFILLGGGVCDSFQAAEKIYGLSERCLNVINQYDFPVHILTKSTLVKERLDIIKMINRKTKAIVSMSFSSVNDEISKIFEPGVEPPMERLKTLEFFKKAGIPCGMFLMPVIPFITDTPKMIEESLLAAKRIGLDFVIFGGMTLKEGIQKDYFLDILLKYNSDLSVEYEMIYKDDKWGMPIETYQDSVNRIFLHYAKKHKITTRIPATLFKNILGENDLVTVILDNIDYYLRINNQRSQFGIASHSISQLQEPLSLMRNKIQRINGVGYAINKVILEILDKGDSSYLKKLMFSFNNFSS